MVVVVSSWLVVRGTVVVVTVAAVSLLLRRQRSVQLAKQCYSLFHHAVLTFFLILPNDLEIVFSFLNRE